MRLGATRPNLRETCHTRRAHNAAVGARLCRCGCDDDIGTPVFYKPVNGERPLWDFPDGTLAQREAAAFVLSAVGGWNLVPPTVLRDGPLGRGSVQQWVDAVEGATQSLIDMVTPAELAPGWHVVLQAELSDGTEEVVAHADSPELASAAVIRRGHQQHRPQGLQPGAGPGRLTVGLRPRDQLSHRPQAAHCRVGMDGPASSGR